MSSMGEEFDGGNGDGCSLCDVPLRMKRIELQQMICDRDQAALLADFRALRDEIREQVRELGTYVAQLSEACAAAARERGR